MSSLLAKLGQILRNRLCIMYHILSYYFVSVNSRCSKGIYNKHDKWNYFSRHSEIFTSRSGCISKIKGNLWYIICEKINGLWITSYDSWSAPQWDYDSRRFEFVILSDPRCCCCCFKISCLSGGFLSNFMYMRLKCSNRKILPLKTEFSQAI